MLSRAVNCRYIAAYLYIQIMIEYFINLLITLLPTSFIVTVKENAFFQRNSNQIQNKLQDQKSINCLWFGGSPFHVHTHSVRIQSIYYFKQVPIEWVDCSLDTNQLSLLCASLWNGLCCTFSVHLCLCTYSIQPASQSVCLFVCSPHLAKQLFLSDCWPPMKYDPNKM